MIFLSEILGKIYVITFIHFDFTRRREITCAVFCVVVVSSDKLCRTVQRQCPERSIGIVSL